MLRRYAFLLLVLVLGNLAHPVVGSSAGTGAGAQPPPQPLPPGPSARSFPSMAYDGAHQRVVLFGGIDTTDSALTDTWTWDGMAWELQQPATSPTTRVFANMAFDEAHGVVILFGGFSCVTRCTFEDCGGPCELLHDTWTWDGASWTAQQPATSPPDATGGMFYDPLGSTIVLFSDFGRVRWVWDGSTWAQQPLTTAPRHEIYAAMTYDAASRQAVRFGGVAAPPQNPTDVVLDETWTWDGTTWMQQHPSLSPPARGLAVMAYDAAHQQIVLFGGIDRSSMLLTDTWTWDGTTWMQQHPATSPQVGAAGMVYDAAHEQVVLLGVDRSTLDGQTWLWDGNNWTEVAQSMHRAASPSR